MSEQSTNNSETQELPQSWIEEVLGRAGDQLPGVFASRLAGLQNLRLLWGQTAKKNEADWQRERRVLGDDVGPGFDGAAELDGSPEGDMAGGMNFPMNIYRDIKIEVAPPVVDKPPATPAPPSPITPAAEPAKSDSHPFLPWLIGLALAGSTGAGGLAIYNYMTQDASQPAATSPSEFRYGYDIQVHKGN